VADTVAAVLAALAAEQPAFHHDGEREQVWSARPETLAYLAEVTRAGDRTVETGSGASTVVFAAAGAEHTAISPVAREHRAIERWCREHGVLTDRLTFVEGYAEEVLPGFYPATPIDVAFVDGKHSFPYPILDWHYLCNSLRGGGVLVLDDVRAPAVEVLCRIMLADPAWELVAAPDREAAAFRRLAEAPSGDPWQQQRLAPPEAFARHLGAGAPSGPTAWIRRALGRPRA
jgi:predicted O-methyltransferase YrrM